MIAFKIQPFKMKMPDIDFEKNLKHISKRFVIPLMQAGIRLQRDVEGGVFPELEKSTKRIKNRKSQGFLTLQATGKLMKAFKYKKVSKNEYQIYINDKDGRDEIGKYLQVDGIKSKSGRKRFKFFGVTDGMNKDAMAYMNFEIRKAIKNAR